MFPNCVLQDQRPPSSGNLVLETGILESVGLQTVPTAAGLHDKTVVSKGF